MYKTSRGFGAVIRVMERDYSLKQVLKGVTVAAAAFVALGTVAALWENPFFVRMTPAGGWEIALLAILSLLLGLYVFIR